MSKRNKKIVLVIFIILFVSASFVATKFGIVSADSEKPTAPTEDKVSLYKNETASQPSQLTTPDNGSMMMALLKLAGALIVVVAGIYGFLLVLRKMMGHKFSGNRNNNLLEVLETTYVAQKKSVSLVRFSDRTVLIGVGDSGISVLAEMDEEETDKILVKIACSENSQSGFKNLLSEAKTKIMGLNMKGVRALQSSKKAENPQTI